MSPADLAGCEHATAPDGVSPVVAAFLRLHVEWMYESSEQWQQIHDLSESSGGYNATLLAEGIVLALDIPPDSPSGVTMAKAFEVLGDAKYLERINRTPESLYVLASTAASLAGEALREWALVNGNPAWTEQNHPFSILLQAVIWAHGHE